MRDFVHVGVLCTFSNTHTSSSNSWGCQKLAAEQLHRAGGTVRHGRRYGPSITVQIIAPLHLSPLARQGMTPYLVGSLRPSASVVLTIRLSRDYHQRESCCMGPCAGADHNLTLCRLQHIYHGQSYARVDLKPCARVDFIALSGTKDLASVH